MRTKLTKSTIDQLIADPRGDRFYFGTKVTGFGVKVTPAGRKIYIYQYRFDGKKRRYTIGTHGGLTPDQARQKAEELAGDVARGVDPQAAKTDERQRTSVASVSDSGPTVRAYAKRWLETEAAQRCKFSTHRFYELNLDRHILPVLGEIPLRGVTRTECKTLIAKCRDKTLKPATIQNICRTLSSVLSQAVEDGLMPANPAFRLSKYYQRSDEPEFEISPLTKDEVAKFLAAAKQHRPREYPLFLCAVLTGLRLGELIGLQWGDIDFGGRFITVRRSRTRGRTTTPKNGKTRRVDMSRGLTAELRILRAARRKEALARGWGDVPEWVFCDTTGGPLDPRNLRNYAFYKVLEKAELRHFRLHDLRHTFCSLLLAQGESIAYVRDQLGHSSIQITVDTYGHLIPGANRAAVDRLDDTLNMAASSAHVSSVKSQ